MKKLLLLLVVLAHQELSLAQERKRLQTPVNLKEHVEYAPSISADGKTLIFQSSRYGLYVNAGKKVPVINSEGRTNKIVQGEMVDFPGVFETKQQTGGEWAKPEPIMSINHHGTGMAPVIGGPSISYDGNSLFFFANYNDPKEGFGREDIYYCTRTKSGWTSPINLGETINSPGYEGFPSISPDGKQLYFVKDNLIKKAEGVEKCYRIMRSELGTDGRWKRPIELPAPVNMDCEKAPRIMADGRTLVYSSIKKGGKGDFDLYYSRFQETGSWSDPVPLDMINTKRSDQSVAISPCGDLLYYVSDGDIFTYTIPEELRPFKMATIQGFVVDSISGVPVKTRVVLTDLITNKVTTSIESSPIDGRFTILAPVSGTYNLTVNERNYRLKTQKIGNADYADCKLITKNFKLISINSTATTKRSDITILTEPASEQPVKTQPVSEIVYTPDIPKGTVEKVSGEQEADKNVSRLVTADSTKKVEEGPVAPVPATPKFLTISVLIRDSETGNAIANTALAIRDVKEKIIKEVFDKEKNVYQALVATGNSIILSASAQGYQPAELKVASLLENKRIVINLPEIKHSVLKIAVRDFQGVPLPASVTLFYTGSKISQTYEVKDGTVEKIFTEPAELEVTAFEQGYTSVTKKVKIEIIPGGKIYEFDAKLDRITYTMSVKVVDIETGEDVPEVTLTLKDLRNGIELTSNTGADAGKEILVPDKGKYEITCTASGYNPHTIQFEINKEKNEVLFKIQKKAKPLNLIAIQLTDKFTGEELEAKITQDGKKVIAQQDFKVSEGEATQLSFSLNGYPTFVHQVTAEEIQSKRIVIQTEKQSYDFDFKALSQLNRRLVSNAKFNIINVDSKEKTGGQVSDGILSLLLSPKSKYVVSITADGFEPSQVSFDAAQALFDNRTTREFLLKPVTLQNVAATKTETAAVVETAAFGELKKGKAITLNNLFFDQSSPVLRAESSAELDKLAEVLTDNPNLRIEIRGHTDNTGNFDANVKLSKERCESVVNYLSGKGISRSRLQYVGRGPIDAVAPNTTEENKKKNRRVEFIVL